MFEKITMDSAPDLEKNLVFYQFLFLRFQSKKFFIEMDK